MRVNPARQQALIKEATQLQNLAEELQEEEDRGRRGTIPLQFFQMCCFSRSLQ